ncbi:hypothetical protein [Parasitella parasitica]|uniref:Dilute domain-containing protein n=1 Tax=Parasitella parasitica TaxID=35722 RepID=A0A0B7N9C4_9FUNG|nr:hypothetical protein [Parasitella parasitica]
MASSYSDTLLQSNPTELPRIKEEFEDDHDVLKKKYENMSFDEMSQHFAESNRQMSEMLSSTPSTSTSQSLDDDLEAEQEEMDEETKKWTSLFSRAASNGDVIKVKEMLSDTSIRQHIDINARDKLGTPPLIYATCFGKTEIAKILIEAGAQIDAQDSSGWSALMWATNNSHEALVKILLEHGASPQTKSAKGRTVFNFINTDNQKIIDILATNPRDSVSSTSSLFCRTSSVSSSTSSTENDFYYQSTVEGFNNFMSEEAELRQRLFESTMQLDFDDSDSTYQNSADDSEEDENAQFDETQFQWDRCSPDQMFVFNSDDLDYILDTVITHIELPLANQRDICVATNIIFLSARFAHYFSSSELLELVLEGALSRIRKAIKTNALNIHVLAFWITNLMQLLFYLKKDTGLVVVTAEQQLCISELISETYNLIIHDTTKRLSKILRPAMLDHEEISGMNHVDFKDDWHRFFRKSARRSVVLPADSSDDTAISAVTPQSITNLLSSTLFVLQSYNVHPIIIVQAMAQFFHFMSCELFNRILTNKKLLCRSKAMQVRINFSHLEDWISVKRLPNHLLGYLNPTIQLLQLLQCLSQLEDLVDFINTSKKFDALNASQVKRCVTSYRYEVNERRIPEEIEKYAMQCAEDTMRHKQKKLSMDKARAAPLSRTQSQKMSKRQSMTHYLGLSKSGPSTPISEELPPITVAAGNEKSTLHRNDDEQEVDIHEIKDTRFMLPFSIPKTAHMTSSHWDSKASSSPNQNTNTHCMIPIIPEEWMDKLDKQQQEQSPVTL